MEELQFPLGKHIMNLFYICISFFRLALATAPDHVAKARKIVSHSIESIREKGIEVERPCIKSSRTASTLILQLMMEWYLPEVPSLVLF